MRMQIFRVKKHLCKILKTKNCVPFEVQYYSSGSRMLSYHYNAAVQDALVRQSLVYNNQEILNQKKGVNNLYDNWAAMRENLSLGFPT